MSIERVWETFFFWKKKPGKIEGKWTLPALSVVHVITVAVSITEHCIISLPYNIIIGIFGFSLFAFAFLVRIYSAHNLGELHSPHIEIRQQHSIVRTGLYKYIRHPYYSSVILELIGFPLFVNTYLTLIVVFFIYFPILYMRITIEENVMEKTLGSPYTNYKAQTPMFFPSSLMPFLSSRLKERNVL